MKSPRDVDAVHVLCVSEALDAVLPPPASVVYMRSAKVALKHIKDNSGRKWPYTYAVVSSKLEPVKVAAAIQRASSKKCRVVVSRAWPDEPSLAKEEDKLRKSGLVFADSKDALIGLLGLPPVGASTAPAAPPAAAAVAGVSRSSTGNAGANTVDNGRGLVYTPGKLLGSGNFGDVYQCQDYFGQHFVLKVLKTNRSKQETEDDWRKEVTFLMSLRHPNIVSCYDSFVYKASAARGCVRGARFNSLVRKGFYNLILERCEGSLRGMRAEFDLTENQVMDVVSQLMSGLHHIHALNIVHRDLQVDNVLYLRQRNHDSGKARFSVKISDFGISALMAKGQDKATTTIGRDYDYAPELVTQGATSTRSDIYQVGLIAYFLITGKAALSVQDGPSHQAVISGNAQKRALELKTPLATAIGQWLDLDPAKRPATCPAAWGALYRSVYATTTTTTTTTTAK